LFENFPLKIAPEEYIFLPSPSIFPLDISPEYSSPLKNFTIPLPFKVPD